MNATREIEGRWWLPEKPTEVYFGILRVSRDHEVELDLKRIGPFSEDELLRGWDRCDPVQAWFGAGPTNEPISVLHCAVTGRDGGLGLFRWSFICSMAVIGHHYRSLDAVRSAQVIADFSFLQEWLDLSSIRTAKHADEGVGVFYQQRRPELLLLNDGSNLYIRSTISTVPSGWGKSQWHITEHHQIALNLSSPESLPEILDRLAKLRWLLSLLMGMPIHLTKSVVLVNSNGPPDHLVDMEKEVEIVGSHLGQLGEDRSLVPGRMLLAYSDVKDQLASLLNRWSEYRERLKPVFDLYFTVLFHPGLLINHAFLFLAQALEVYHRLNFDGKVVPTADFRARLDRLVASASADDTLWLREKLNFANQKTLAERLSEILAKYPDETHAIVGDPTKFSSTVRHTRNGYTHFEKKLWESGKVADVNDLVPLTDRMQRLLEVCFLRDLGLTGKPIKKIVGRQPPRVHRFGEGTD